MTGCNATFGRVPLLTFTLALSFMTTLMQPVSKTHADSGTIDDAPLAGQRYRTLQDRPDRLIVELPNRMIVVAQELKSAPVVSAQVYVKTGSIYEQEHVGAGLSHFLEHLLAGGATKTRKETESNAILGQIGGQTNASTGMDTVRYYINTTRPYATEAIDLLSDWMKNSLITQNDYERERSVIQREFEMGDGDPGRIFWKLTQQSRYAAHPARHPTIGYLDEFLKISRDEIFDFYKRMYVPNNMIFIVTGDIDRRKVVDQVADLWAGVAPHALPKLAFPVEPSITSPRSASGMADIERPRLRLAWPGTKLGDEHDYALDLLATILGDGESSRLVRSVRDAKRLMNTVTSYNQSMHWGEGFFGIEGEVAVSRSQAIASTQPAADKSSQDPIAIAVEAAKAAVLEQVALVRDNGVTEDELARAKRQITASHAYSTQTAHALAERLADDIIATGDPDYMARYVRSIQDVTPEQIKAAAKRFLTPERLLSLTLLPAPAGTRTPPLARPAQDVNPASLPQEPADIDNAPLAKRIAAAKDTGDQRILSSEPVRKVVLPNGLRLLVGRSSLVPAVAIQWYQTGGQLIDPTGKEGTANAMALMLSKGTKTRSAIEIAQTIDNLGADLGGSCGANSVYARATCLKQDWKTILDLFADVMLNPSFPDDEWTRLQPRLLAAIDRQTDSWGGELGKAFRQNYFGSSHPWSVSAAGKRDVVAALTAADLRAFHASFLAAPDSVLSIVGDVDPDEVVRQVEKLFAKMPAPQKPAVRLPVPTPPGASLIQTQTNKKLAAVQIGLGPGVTRDHPDYASITLLTHVLSSFPTGWLDQALRGEQTGLVYVVGSYQVTGLVPGYVAVIFNAKPPAVAEALQKTSDVLNRARTELVDEATLARAKAGVLTDEFMGKQSNEDRAAEAALQEMYGLGLGESEKFLARIQSITPEDLRATAKKYLTNPVVVVMTNEPVPRAELLKAFPSAASAELSK
jgi:zinc protease